MAAVSDVGHLKLWEARWHSVPAWLDTPRLGPASSEHQLFPGANTALPHLSLEDRIERPAVSSKVRPNHLSSLITLRK